MSETADSAPEAIAKSAVRRARACEVAPRLGVGRLSRHLLVCGGPACCDASVGAKTWGTFKRRLAHAGLDGRDPEKAAVFRTRCHCLGVCNEGPIAVVYPEGTWYRHVDAKAAERIVDEHLVGGRVVEEHLFARDALGGEASVGAKESETKDDQP